VNGSGNRFYRPGMTGTSAYNSGLNGQGQTYRTVNSNNNNNTWYRGNNNTNTNTYRPTFQNSQPVRSYTPSMGGGGGGGGGFSRPGRH
jgi:hypothetical protein